MIYYNSRGVAMRESAVEQARIAGSAAGNETINAPAGHSSLSGEGGGDRLVGSSGDNRHWITDPKDVVVEQLDGGIDTQIGWTSIKLASNVENLQVNGAFNYAVGNELGNLIVLDNESHWIYGAGGDDVLVGGLTAKVTYVVKAGEGSDVIYNWNGNSQIQLLGYGLDNATKLRGAMTQSGADVVTRLSETETLTFRGVTLEAFSDRQFLLQLDLTKLGALTFSDEFNTLQVYDHSLQTGQWRTDFGGNLRDPWAFTLPSNGERQVYTSSGFYGQGEADLDFNPFSVRDGVLTITAERIPEAQRDAAWGREYSSGIINTLGTFEQKYGYFEVRAELPTAVGSWPAFWMMPSPYVAQVEADIFEALALTPNVDYRRAWGGGDNLYDNAYKTDPAGFHTYGMLWTPTTVTFYYDSVAVLQAPTPINWVHPMGLIVNLAVGGWGGEPNSLQFPTELKIDYVRAYALAEGGTVIERGTPEPPAATLRAAGGPTSGEVNTPVVFDAGGQPVTSAKIAVYDTRPADLPPGKSFVVWEDAGAVFGAVSDGTSLGQSTVLMAGDSRSFTGSGTWLSDGKVVLGYMMPDGAGQAGWAMVFDPAKLTLTRHELGPSTGDLDFVATANGGFAASWDAPGGTVMGRGYDAFAYDATGWYGPARQLSADLTGVTAQGELIATNDQGVQQLYNLVNPPRAVLAAVSVGPMAGVAHTEGSNGFTLYTFTVIRDWDQSEQSTVGWTVRGQGANPANALDFQGGVLPSGQLTFEVGQTTASIQIWVAGDGVVEANEEFLVSLVNPVATKLGQATATGFITDDDAPAPPPPAPTQLAFSTSSVSHSEGISGFTAFAYTVVRTGSTIGTSSVNWSVSGTGSSPANAADFQNAAIPSGVLTFAAGETSRTLTVNLRGDTSVEADEAFAVTLSGATGATLGVATATGVIVNDDAALAPAPDGDVITSDSYGDSLTGGAGSDTLIAGQGPDVLTGGAGGDAFVFRDVVWNPGKVTDFALGTDRLDFSALFQRHGYTGSDPVADRYVIIGGDASGGATIAFDSDGVGAGNPWPVTMTTLNGVSPVGLTWAELAGPGAQPPQPPPPPGSEPGVVINSPGPGSTLRGGAGADTLNASQGPDILVGGAGADAFVYAGLPWSAGRITDFTVGSDRLDLSAIFRSSGYTGADPIADGRMRLDSDGSGGTQVYFDRDAPGAGDWPFLVTTLDAVSPSGLTWAKLSGAGGSSPPAASPQVALTTTSLSLSEGDSGLTAFTYNVARTGPTTGTSSVNWTLSGTGANPAGGSDFSGGAMPSGTLVFAAGETAKTLVVQVSGDSAIETAEDFTVTLSGVSGATLGVATATGQILNDDGGAPAGRVVTSTGPGDTLVGGSGADTLNASRGSDVLTGGGGADRFVWNQEPWSPARVTDFTLGADRIDLSSLFQASGYAGSDPVGDKYILLFDDGAGGTKLLFDRDAAAAGQPWANYIIHLENVPTAGLTWAQLSGGGSPPPTPPPPPPPTPTSGGASTMVVFAGQSNVGGAFMQASTVSAAWKADPLTQIWDLQGKTWVQMQPGVNTGYGGNNSTWGPEVQFAIDFRAAHPDQVLRIVKHAEGGTGLNLNSGAYVADWSPNSANELFDKTATIISEASAAAGGLRPSAVFFGQGEEDANTLVAADAYDENLPVFLSAVRAEWMGNAQGKIGIFRIGDNPTYSSQVRAAQLQTDLADPNTDSFDTARYPLQADNLHFAAQGYDMAGAEFFRLYSGWGTGTPGQVVSSTSYGATLNGGAGADTLNAGQGPDVLTGAGGADHFVFANAPWNAGRITDFTPGVDKIDLRGILDQAGYTGVNAIADGYVILEATASGTRVIIDLDGPSANGQWPVTVTTLSGVMPASLASGDWIFQ